MSAIQKRDLLADGMQMEVGSRPLIRGGPASYITEVLPFQYAFFVPQDISGLIEMEHGPQAFVAKLDELFARGFYDHGNEPSHHIAYLYDYAVARPTNPTPRP
jgi:putative alpha-1,2-mannosidase